MNFSKEDLAVVAKKAKMTPEEVLDILQEVKPELKLTEEPGLATLINKEKMNQTLQTSEKESPLLSRMFRFTLESSLSKYNNFKNTVAEFKFDLIKKNIKIGLYEIFQNNEDFLTARPLEDWILMDHSMDLLKFKSYNSTGDVLSEINFQNLEVISDENTYNYENSNVCTRIITLKFNKFTKDITII